MLYFTLGIIIGILIRDIKFETIKSIEKYKENKENREKTSFVEPINKEEKWKNADNISQLLDNNS